VTGNTAGEVGGGGLQLPRHPYPEPLDRGRERRGGAGGGIYSAFGTASLDDSTVSGNLPDNCVGVAGC
jgi:putative cofactor-binding repeat protein